MIQNPVSSQVSEGQEVGLAGLNSGKAKPSTRASLSLIPLSQVELGRVNLKHSFVSIQILLIQIQI
jgi:hypothetical protein